MPALFESSPPLPTLEKKGSVWALASSLLCYGGTLVTFTYFVLLISDVWVPRGINGPVTRALALAMAINLGLILAWGLQHSVMARERFKRRWTRLVPAHTERATYCLASCLALLALCFYWSPIEGQLWHLQGAQAISVRLLGALGWVILLAASFEIDHFELFGIKQSYAAMRGRELPSHAFQQRFLYRVVRHLMQLGVFVGMWATPRLTASHALFAGLMTLYILVGLYFEERDLTRSFGERYRAYGARVPKLLPSLRLLFGERRPADVATGESPNTESTPVPASPRRS